MNLNGIRKLIEILAAKRPLFHNEKDFQYSLAHEIKGEYEDAILYLEGRPLRIQEDLNYDICIHHKGTETFIELKYKPAKFGTLIDSERFDLKYQSAQDLNSYDYLYDVWKLEQTLVSGRAVGFAIFLTNDSLYWRGAKMDSDYYPFRLENERTLKGREPLSWLNNKEKKGKMRQLDIILGQDYVLDWKHYSTIENGEPSAKNQFKYLLLEVESAR